MGNKIEICFEEKAADERQVHVVWVYVFPAFIMLNNNMFSAMLLALSV